MQDTSLQWEWDGRDVDVVIPPQHCCRCQLEIKFGDGKDAYGVRCPKKTRRIRVFSVQ